MTLAPIASAILSRHRSGRTSTKSYTFVLDHWQY